MITEQRQIIKKYLDIVLRRKVTLIFCLIVGVAIGLAQYLNKPKVYRCTALLKYQRQSINPTAMSPDDLRTRTTDVVEAVSQQIMSRSSLEEIIKDFNLYTAMQRNMSMEDIVEIMREYHIQTTLLKNGDIFEVSYQGKDPDKVMKVTNALAARFIEENLRFRQEKASQTTTYVRDELNMIKITLDEKEQVMRDYKLKYYNELPEQVDNNTSRLTALQAQYQNNQSSSLELERTRLLVQEQISQRKKFLMQISSGTPTDTPEISQTPELNTFQEVRLRLQQLSTRYKENHPEIKRLKKILRDLENQHYALTPDQSENTSSTIKQVDPQILELRQQLKEVEFNIQRLNKERKDLAEQITKYENWISAAPVREAEWSALTRDYDQLNAHYQGLVTQRLQAESAQTLENQLRGSQFTIIDPAHFPEKPFKPDFQKIMLMAIGLCLGIGAVLSLGLEMLSTTFKDPYELEDYLEVPVLCAIPILPTKRERIKSRFKSILQYSFLTFAGVSVIGAVLYYWKQGAIIL